MIVIVMRHGEAQGLGAGISTDSQRNLTDNGIAQAIQSGQKIADKYNVKKVIASVYNRATQTGQQVAKVTNSKLELTEDIALNRPNLKNITNLLDSLSLELDADDAVVLVSHIPLVYDLCEICCPYANVHYYPAAFGVFDYNQRKFLDSYIPKV